jgi:hypothetical protein
MPPKFNGFTVEEPSSTRVDMPMPIVDNPRRHGLISEYNPNLIDKIGNLVPDTGIAGVLKGLYSGTDRNVFGLLPSGNYETVSPESDLGEAISVIADPIAGAKGLRALNSATLPIRIDKVKKWSTNPTGRAYSKNYNVINKLFDDIGIPVNYPKTGKGRTAGSLSTNVVTGDMKVNMFTPSWYNLKQQKEGAFDTLLHEKIHALQRHSQAIDEYEFGQKWHKSQTSKKWRKLLASPDGTPFHERAYKYKKTLTDVVENKRPLDNKRFNPDIKWRLNRALEDALDPSSYAFKSKGKILKGRKKWMEYVRAPRETEARIGSIWGTGRLKNNRQLSDLLKSGYSNKEIEGMLWNFDKSMKRFETQDVYDKLFNSRKSLLQQYNIK